MIKRLIQSVSDAYWLASLPCHEAARLISKSMEDPLPWKVRSALRIHLGICRLCRRYHGQLNFLRRALQNWDCQDPTLTDTRLPPLAKNRIKARLARETNKRGQGEQGFLL